MEKSRLDNSGVEQSERWDCVILKTEVPLGWIHCGILREEKDNNIYKKYSSFFFIMQ